MAGPLSGRRVAILATDGVEQSELAEPWKALEQAGATVDLVSLKEGEIQAVKHTDPGDKFKVTRIASSVTVHDFDALVLPGGVRNPDILRTDPDAVRLVRDFMAADKPVGAVCHGPWMLVEADAVHGRTLTSWPSLKTDIRNAGGSWVDKQVEVDQKLVTSRKPEDLPAFCTKLVTTIASAIEERRLDRTVEQSFPASDPPPGPIALP
jgi:protease I